jgi:hypothetical protein
MSSKKLVLIAVMLMFLFWGALVWKESDRKVASDVVPMPAKSRSDSPVNRKMPVAQTQQAGKTKTVSRPHFEYFHRDLIKNELVSHIYQAVKKKLPDGELAELVAVYVSEGPVRNSSPEFARFMESLHEDIRSRSNELHELLIAQDDQLKEDPFIYQMALNLAFQLEVSPERKARILGSALKTHFERDEEHGVTFMTANITNALILMKNSKVPLAVAMPYLRVGLAVNSDNPEAVREYVARANAYYPGAF